MINQINIQNFKSIVDLDLPLGRFNVIIGPNGCGKTNVLEAISFAAAASQNKLDYEYLVNRDVRLTDSKFMVNAFEEEDKDEEEEHDEKKVRDSRANSIFFATQGNGRDVLYQVVYDEKLKKWVNFSDEINRLIYSILTDIENDDKSQAETYEKINYSDLKKLRQTLENSFSPDLELGGFLTYRPTEHFLRKTFDTPIFPLGVHGEGLLKYLKETAGENNVEIFKEINQGLELLDWFDGFQIPENLMTDEYRLAIGDKYLKDSLHYFDQRSTNEGFLFLLFYLTLFNSDDTPSFFAIDNIETALNPKLVTRLTDYLIKRSFDKSKQVIVTTHSPFVLDALDLSNPDQRLYVARRDIDGHTRLERIHHHSDREMSLSQLWMSGLIGGLPDNF